MTYFLFNYLFPCILEFFCVYVLYCGCFHFALRDYLPKIPFLLLTIVCCTVLELIFPLDQLSSLILFLCYTIGFLPIFRQSFLHTLLAFGLSHTFISVFEIITVSLLGFSLNPVDSILIKNIGSVILLLCCFIIYRFIPLFKLFHLIQTGNISLLLIFANSALIIVGIVFLIKTSLTSFYASYFVLLSLLTMLIFLNGEMFVNHNKALQHQKQLETYQAYLPIVEQLLDEVRERQHDYHNNIQTIRSLVYTCDTFEELKENLICTTEHYIAAPAYYNILKINLHLLAGFLISKISEASALHKTLHIEVLQTFLHSNCTEYELIEYVGILIDNAIEATKTHDTIYASLDCQNNQIVFQIQNPGPLITPDFCQQIFSKNYTTKNSSFHGIGLYKLNKFVTAHQGDIALSNIFIHEQTFISFTLTL